jgi:predicted nucleic acid-binding protein
LLLLDGVKSGAYELTPFSTTEVAEATDVISRYAGLGLSLADASVVVLADRMRTNRVLTIDERDFRAMTPLTTYTHFHLLPADG